MNKTILDPIKNLFSNSESIQKSFKNLLEKESEKYVDQVK
jgi:hypothetical protein